MSIKTKLARQAVKKTAKHTAHGTVSRLAHRPFRSLTLLALGALLGGVVGWLVGRSGRGQEEAPIGATGPTSVVTAGGDASGHGVETGAVS